MRNTRFRNATMKLSLVLFTVGILGLAGCESARDPQMLQNPNYVSGYSDGCQSAQTRIPGFDDTITRNAALAEIEPAYDLGWRDGYAACGEGDFDTSDGATREPFRRGSEHYTTAPY